MDCWMEHKDHIVCDHFAKMDFDAFAETSLCMVSPVNLGVASSDCSPDERSGLLSWQT